MNFDDYYELFGIESSATLEEIQRAYRKTKGLYSPDSPAIYSMFSAEEAKELIKVIDEAYQVLSNPVRRSEYDMAKKLDQNAENWNGESSPMDDAIYGLSGESSGDFSMDQTPAANFAAEAQTSQAQSANTQPAPSPAELANDQGQTRFGTYVLDDEVEEYIKGEENIDGNFLKTVREYKGVSLDQIATVTKIGSHHLKAIEENDFSSLPAPVFTKAFVKQYAQLIGLDAKKCADSFAETMLSEKA